MDALPCYTADKNIRLFELHRVLSESELRSRRDIGLDSYAKMINIEAETMLMMARRQILPAVLKYSGTLSLSLASVKAAGFSFSNVPALLSDLCVEIDRLKDSVDALAEALSVRPETDIPLDAARYMHDCVLPVMAALRASADRLECITDRSCWPFPTYDELLFSIQ